MKIKSVLSVLTLVTFGILAGGSIDENGDFKGWFWGLLISLIVILNILNMFDISENKKKRKAEKERRKKALQRKKEKKVAYEEARSELAAKKGEPDKTIVIEESNMDAEIRVYETVKEVHIAGKEFKFKDIMNCTFSDSPRTIKGQIIAETKSKNSSAIGRAVVGDILAGPVGAIIGGATGKKNTVYHQKDDKVVHDYTVIINVNSIVDPIIRIHTRERENLTNEIIGLMNVIISRK